jgi:ribosomal protein S18 acetylase RimI-like enzyme
MRVGTLETTSFATLCAAFDRAFGGYAASFPASDTFLEEMLRRRGVRLELSVGVWEGGELIGFTLNGLDGDTGYDSGTGVVPAHRGRGLAAVMLERTFALLRDAGATRYQLEVLEANRRAVGL